MFALALGDVFRQLSGSRRDTETRCVTEGCVARGGCYEVVFAIELEKSRQTCRWRITPRVVPLMSNRSTSSQPSSPCSLRIVSRSPDDGEGPEPGVTETEFVL